MVCSMKIYLNLNSAQINSFIVIFDKVKPINSQINLKEVSPDYGLDFTREKQLML